MRHNGHTVESLVKDLHGLCLVSGDLVFVHSSFKSLGFVAGGAQTVVDALTQVVGPDGLILMPSFNLVAGQDNRAALWNPDTTPSTVGWLTEFFRQMPGTYRSDHYSHSVAARGKDAAVFVAGHRGTDGLKSPWDLLPWGKTYGTSSPMMRAYNRQGKVLMIGVDYDSSTYIHLVEVMYWNTRLAQDEKASYLWLNRQKLGDFWDHMGQPIRGKVGDADCRCFSICAYVDTLLAEVKRDPDSYDRVQHG
jgi:aminoglycoside N3'-acetyltransferase